MCIVCRAKASKRTVKEQEAFEKVQNAEDLLRLAKEAQESLEKEKSDKDAEDKEADAALASAFKDTAARIKKSRKEDAEAEYPKLAKELRKALDNILSHQTSEYFIILSLTRYAARIRRNLFWLMDRNETAILRNWNLTLMDDDKIVTYSNDFGPATHIRLRFSP